MKIKIVIWNVYIFLKQILGIDGEGNNVFLGDFFREWVEVQCMMRELWNRNFGKYLREVEVDKRELQFLLNWIRIWQKIYQGENNGFVNSIWDFLNEYEVKFSDFCVWLQEVVV